MRKMLFALIMLTSLDGSPVWVESEQIIIIRPAKQQQQLCKEGVGAGIYVGTKAFCVLETPEQIHQKIRESK